MDNSDEQLMQRFQVGDKKAFEILMGRYERAIFNFVLKIIVDYQRAEDICQEVFIRLFKNAHRYDPSKRFSPWLYRIASHLCIDELRRHGGTHPNNSKDRSKEIVDNLGLLKNLQAVSGSPEEKLKQKEIISRVKEALSSLPDDSKLIIILKHYQGLSYQEISQILDLPQGTVKSRMHYALNHLKTKLKKACFPWKGQIDKGE